MKFLNLFLSLFLLLLSLYFPADFSDMILPRYSLSTYKCHKSNIKNLLVKSSAIVFIIWQIKLISHRSDFWHLSRKPAVIFSKWIFFQNSLGMLWAIWSGKMQIEKTNTSFEFFINKFLIILLWHLYVLRLYYN